MKTTDFLLYLAITVVIYVIGFSIDMMDVDATQYASITREMLEKNDWIHFTNRYVPYLDKPPLIFWLSAICYKIFGMSNFAYKLPSFLFSLLALYSTYKFCKLYYQENIARLAVLITASCQAFFMMNNDCRTDTVLTGAVMMSIFHISAYILNKKIHHFILGFIGLGLAMLAKGPIGLIVPAVAIGGDLLIKADWKNIFKLQWIVGLIIVSLMLVPMCIGLYEQYGNEGLEFYFWKQSFGRITGDNDFVKSLSSNDYVNDPFFFYHTFLWAFSPWPIIFIGGLVIILVQLFKQKFKINRQQELITLIGFIFTLWAMSMSHYKLPHYIFMAFPLAGIITSRFLIEQINDKIIKWMFPLHIFLMAVLWGLCFYLITFSFSSNNLPSIFIYILLLGVTIFVTYRSQNWLKIFNLVMLTAIMANFFLNAHIYPRLLKYQTSGSIGKIIKEQKIPTGLVYNYTGCDHSLDVYSQSIISSHGIEEPKWKNKDFFSGEYLILFENEFQEIKKNKIAHQLLFAGDKFSVTILTPEFLNPTTRSTVTRKHYFIKLL